MVECESISFPNGFGTGYSFNRYMVECESSTAMLNEFVDFVLIDTWWNVNQSFGEEQLKEAFRFNRYMVECEYFYGKTPSLASPGFNRYMVECEFP